MTLTACIFGRRQKMNRRIVKPKNWNKKVYGDYGKEISRLIQRQIGILEQARAEALDKLKRSPEGKLYSCSEKDGKVRFYLKSREKGGKNKYLNAKRTQLIGQLSEKRYYEDLLRESEREIKILQSFCRRYDPEGLTGVHGKMPAGMRNRVFPVFVSDEDYAGFWSDEEYAPYQRPVSSGEAFVTENGEIVRSKSELIIANMLKEKGIPYRYEQPVKVGDEVFHPDFTILNKKERKTYYWEHMGMMGDSEYVNNAIRKIGAYEKAGILVGKDLILTFESWNYPLSSKVVRNIIDEICLGL